MFVTNRLSAHPEMDWIIVGSAASLIQGCQQIQPNDIDIMVKHSSDVNQITSLFMDYLSEISPSQLFNKHWFSSKCSPTYTMVLDKKVWSFARLHIIGVNIEISNTTTHEYLELSDVIWKIKRFQNYLDTLFPVVPLELQLHSSYVLDKPERIQAIKEVIRRNNLDLHFLKSYLTDSAYRQLTE